MMVGVACISMHNNNGDVTSITVTVPTDSPTVAVPDSTNTSDSALIGGILGAALILVVVITCIIFCCTIRAKKNKVYGMGVYLQCCYRF